MTATFSLATAVIQARDCYRFDSDALLLELSCFWWTTLRRAAGCRGLCDSTDYMTEFNLRWSQIRGLCEHHSEIFDVILKGLLKEIRYNIENVKWMGWEPSVFLPTMGCCFSTLHSLSYLDWVEFNAHCLYRAIQFLYRQLGRWWMGSKTQSK